MSTSQRLSADSLYFSALKHFQRDEFPNGVLENIDNELVLGLDEYRQRLGHPLVPSPLAGAWYRKDGSKTSRHYAVGRLSDAGDVFPQCDIRDALLVALHCDWWGGIGVYLDTNGPNGKPQPMLHLDLRPQRQLWLRYQGQYIYPLRSANERRRFWVLLGGLDYEAA